MQVKEEIDALKTLGTSPMDFLVLPRMLALVIMMPILCVYADIMGIISGLIVGVGMLNLGPIEYLNQTKASLSIEVVSEPRITPEGKAQADSNAQQPPQVVSISRGLQRRHRTSDGVTKPLLSYFRIGLGDQIALRAHWQVFTGDGKKLLDSGHSVFGEKAEDTSIEALVSAESRAAERFSRELGAAMVRLAK